MCKALMERNSYCTFTEFIGSHVYICIFDSIISTEHVCGVVLKTRLWANLVELKLINPFLFNLFLIIMIIIYNVRSR